MQFKFKAKPDSRIQYSIIPFDQQFCSQETASYLLDQYRIIFDPADASKNNSDLFKIVEGTRIKQIAILNLTDKFDHQAILQVFLDFAVSQKTQLVSKIQIELGLVDPDMVIPAAVQAFELSTYDLALYQTPKKPGQPLLDPKAESFLLPIMKYPKPRKITCDPPRSLRIIKKK